MIAWVAGRVLATTEKGIVWGLKGVFVDAETDEVFISGEDRAIYVCNDDKDFIFPVEINADDNFDFSMPKRYFPLVINFDEEEQHATPKETPA